MFSFIEKIFLPKVSLSQCAAVLLHFTRSLTERQILLQALTFVSMTSLPVPQKPRIFKVGIESSDDVKHRPPVSLNKIRSDKIR